MIIGLLLIPCIFRRLLVHNHAERRQKSSASTAQYPRDRARSVRLSICTGTIGYLPLPFNLRWPAIIGMPVGQRPIASQPFTVAAFVLILRSPHGWRHYLKAAHRTKPSRQESRLGTWSTLSIGLGGMIGGGIFAVTGLATPVE